MWKRFSVRCRKTTEKTAANSISAPRIIWYTLHGNALHRLHASEGTLDYVADSLVATQQLCRTYTCPGR